METLNLETTQFPLIPQKDKDQIIEKFVEYKSIAEDWAKKAYTIKVTSLEDKEAIQDAKDAYKLLKGKRVELEKKRKQLKDKSLQEGKFIDSIAKALEAIIEPAEKHLEQQAKYAEILKKQEADALKNKRAELLAPYREIINPDEYPLETLSDMAFDTILNGAKVSFEQYKAKKEEEEKARLAEEEAKKNYLKRSLEIAPYKEYGIAGDLQLTLTTTEDEYLSLLDALKGRKAIKDKEREEMAKELAAEKEKAAQAEAEKQRLAKEKEELENKNKNLQQANAELKASVPSVEPVVQSAIDPQNADGDMSTEEKLDLAIRTLKSSLVFIIPDNLRKMIYDTLNKIEPK